MINFKWTAIETAPQVHHIIIAEGYQLNINLNVPTADAIKYVDSR